MLPTQPALLKDRQHGHDQNVEVKAQAGTLYVGNIQAQTFIEFQLGAAEDLHSPVIPGMTSRRCVCQSL